MLCLDASYRTQEGLLRLVQKEWCSFGHKFRTRLALGDSPTGEYSPIFIQWLECVYQLFKQFPSAFEWTPMVLLRLAREALSSKYGTFLCDSEKERCEKVMPFTLSLWEELLRPEVASQWFNWDYQPTTEPLVPQICQATYAVWEEYWFRNHPRWQRIKPQADPRANADDRPGNHPASSPASQTDKALGLQSTQSPPPAPALAIVADEVLESQSTQPPPPSLPATVADEAQP